MEIEIFNRIALVVESEFNVVELSFHVSTFNRVENLIISFILILVLRFNRFFTDFNNISGVWCIRRYEKLHRKIIIYN